MKTFNIIKKNRKYFAATTNGYKCKVLIDDNSKGMEVGTHELEVDDISVTTKYGTDVIYKLSASIDEIKEAGICTLQHPRFNLTLINRCKELGGKWDKEAEVWVFSSLVEDQIEALDEQFNSDIGSYEITFITQNCFYNGPAELGGYKLAEAYGRDSGAKHYSENCVIINGGFSSGGSMKNWKTNIDQGTIIRMELPKYVAEEVREKYDIVDLEITKLD